MDDAYPQVENLSNDQKKICAKAKLLIAKYNDETTNVDVDVNIGYYKESVEVFKQWEKSLVRTLWFHTIPTNINAKCAKTTDQ